MALSTYLLRRMKYLKVFSDTRGWSSYLKTNQEEFDEFGEEKSNRVENVLKSTNIDVSNITPHLLNTFNIAAYINKSDTLQQLVKLNVNLSKIEKKTSIVENFLKLNFERDMKGHIIFLSSFVSMDNMGEFITKNPMIFYETIEDLQVRINYLLSKNFVPAQINRILTKNPFWLMFSTVRIDRRFGFYQKTFDLKGTEVRYLATKQPKLITYNVQHVKCNHFVIKEEMGFEDVEVKKMLLEKPKLWMIDQKILGQRFNYIHNIMKISHEAILESPEVLLSRNFRIKQRHMFLEKLGRAQYDPKQENYVPIKCLVQNTDIEFCNTYAKCNVNDFNVFLKTL